MRGLSALASTRGLLGVVLPLLLTAALHYGAPHHAHWVHDVARRLFYLPIVLGAALGGWRAGIAVALAVQVVYFPHAFLPAFGMDPSSTSEKVLEMAFYVVLGGLSGAIVDRLQAAQQHSARLVEELQATNAELSRTLAEVRAKDAQLARAARLESLGQLTAGLAHEIKNPLHAMRGTAEIVLDAVPEGSEEHELGEAMVEEIDRLDGVLRRFLDFARPSEPGRSPVRLDEVAARVAALVRAQASRQGTAIEVVGPEVEALADPDVAVQVVLGVVLNALQALGGGGTVTLRTSASPPALAIENDGPPIPEDLLDRIFDPFVSGRPGGTGLGLSTAWSLVEAMGGALAAENLPGDAGVRFLLRLPPRDGATPATGDHGDLPGR